MSVFQTLSDIYQVISVGAARDASSWAMMMVGFGSAGAIMRRGRTYRLVETLPDGVKRSEEFAAPDDDTAARRARTVAEGQMELWRGSVRIAPTV